jgi:hypothetical protein
MSDVDRKGHFPVKQSINRSSETKAAAVMWVWLLTAVVLLLALILMVAWVSRPRALPIPELPLDTTTGPDPERDVHVFIAAPSSSEGVNQYTVPAASEWARAQGYKFHVCEGRTVLPDMIRVQLKERPVFMVGLTNRIMITQRAKSGLDRVFRDTQLAAALEECTTPWLCNNVWNAYVQGDPATLWQAALTPDLFVVRGNAPRSTELLRSMARCGYIQSRFKVTPLPSNLVANYTNLDTKSLHDAPLLGYRCERSDQLKEIYETIAHRDQLAPIQVVRDHLAQNPGAPPDPAAFRVLSKGSVEADEGYVSEDDESSSEDESESEDEDESEDDD